MEISIRNSDKLLKKYDPLIKSMANKFSAFDFEESYDEAKMVALEAILSFDENKSNFGGYLKYSLYYHFLDKSKQVKVSSLNDFDSSGREIQESLSSDLDIEEDMILDEKYEKLYEVIEDLEERDRKLIKLKYIYNLSHKEIGKILKLSTKTITNRNYLIKKKLKEKID